MLNLVMAKGTREKRITGD